LLDNSAAGVRHALAVVSLSLIAEGAAAGSVLDYIRDYDLNDYSLGLYISGTQNLYAGAKDSGIAYPYLTSFRNSQFTDDWVLIRDGELGFRWVSENGWQAGAIGRIQTRGFGNTETDELLGVAERKWTLEAGPTIGWRGWPVQFNFTTYAELTDRHDGLVSELSVLLPWEGARGFFVPSLDLIYQDDDYADYYYSVTAAEATPTRPAYQGQAATNVAFRLRWGYALSDKWLLAGHFGLERLDSSITASPIVDRDRVLSAGIGLAYNADLFQPREYDLAGPKQARFEIRVSGFFDTIDTKVTKDTVDGVPGFEADLEDFLGAPDEEIVLQMDAVLRLAHYHRLEIGWFELGRNSTIVTSRDFAFGDEVFPAGTEVDVNVDASVFRAGYAYSLIRNAQLELAVMAGVHVTDLDTEIVVSSTGQKAQSIAGTPLPVIGAQAAVFLTDKTTIGARLQAFRTDFDRYEGSLNYAMIDIQHQLRDNIGVGLAYNYYGIKLTSSDRDVNGSLKIVHHGPMLFLSVSY
jgi:outer membrane scaffolding protein for murein synthesis (MipA/OmpV family)